MLRKIMILLFGSIILNAQSELFISEYLEGSGYNKAIEIYNPTNVSVDLSNYRIAKWNNGGTSTAKDTIRFLHQLAPNDVYIIANSAAVQTILDQADTTHSITLFNGDDYLALQKFSGSNWNDIDVFGEATGVDPGDGWTVAGIPSATREHTLIRKSNISYGTTDWAESAGTDSVNSQWQIYSQDTFIFLGAHPGTNSTANPEPSEYPTNFIANAPSTTVTLIWDDALGSQLPDGYLLIGYDISHYINPPIDGVEQNDDVDFSDGIGVLNINYGIEYAAFPDLEPNTNYHFEIYPYSNEGVLIDYKTDGVVPQLDIQTGEELSTIFYEDFETGFNSVARYDVAGSHVWASMLGGGGANNTSGYAEINGYPYIDERDNDWLILPAFNFSVIEEPTLSFFTKWKYGQDGELSVFYSEDYSGSGDPSLADWFEIPFDSPITADVWAEINLDLSFLEMDNVHIAFNYLEHPPEMFATRRWDVDEIQLTGVTTVELDFPPSVESVTRNVKVPTTDGSTVVTAEVTDDNGITSVSLVYIVEGVTIDTPMTNTSGDFYEGTIPAAVYGDGSLVSYYVVAFDNAEEPQIDTSGTLSFFAGNTDIAVVKTLDENGVPLYNGLYARLTGVTTAGSGTYSTGRLEGYIQDSTAGISVFNNNFTTPELINGNSYTVIGRITNYNGLIETVPDVSEDITDNGAVGVPEPIVLTIPEFYSNPEMYDGMLIKIDNMTISSTTPWDCQGSGSNLEFYVDGDTIIVRIDADTDICGAEEPSWPRDIVTIVGQYDNSPPYFEGYQLLPRSIYDFITTITDTLDAVLPNIQTTYNSENIFIEVPLLISSTTNKNVISYQFTIEYDPALVDATGINVSGTLSEASGWSVLPNTLVDGEITVGAFGANPLSGEGELVKVVFEMTGLEGTTQLHFRDFVFNSGDPMAITTDGSINIVLGMCGDANEDGYVYAQDAAFTLQHSIGLIELSAQGAINADVNMDGNATAFDAALILRYVIGLPEPVETCFDGGSKKSGTATFASEEDVSSFNIIGNSIEFPINGNRKIVNLLCGGIDGVEGVYSIEYDMEVTEGKGDIWIEADGEGYMHEMNRISDRKVKIAIINPEGISSEDIKIKVGMNKGEDVEEIKITNIKLNEIEQPILVLTNLVTDLEITEYKLVGSYPNPFNPSTKIVYEIPENAKVNIIVYDILGRKITELVNAEMERGRHEIEWKGINNHNERVSSGTYIIMMRTNEYQRAVKVNLLK